MFISYQRPWHTHGQSLDPRPHRSRAPSSKRSCHTSYRPGEGPGRRSHPAAHAHHRARNTRALPPQHTWHACGKRF
eukprot:12420531-Karenia_brevis.AAC.1